MGIGLTETAHMPFFSFLRNGGGGGGGGCDLFGFRCILISLSHTHTRARRQVIKNDMDAGWPEGVEVVTCYSPGAQDGRPLPNAWEVYLSRFRLLSYFKFGGHRSCLLYTSPSPRD